MAAMDRTEVTVYDSYELKDQWEKRAQQFNDVEKQEKQRKEKSALNGLFKQWQVDLSVRHGVSPASEKKGKGSDMSDFRKYVVKAAEDQENDKLRYVPKIRASPPKKPPPRPPSPPPKKRLPPPPPKPRKERAPKPVEKKPEPIKMPTLKKVEKPKVEHKTLPKIERIKVPEPDNFSQAAWARSWKMMKSPLHQQKSVETSNNMQDSKQEPMILKQTNDKMYKSLGYDFEKQWGSPAESWMGSWKQLKNTSENGSTEDMSFFEIISQGKWWRTYEEIDTFSLPRWAGTWKTINFVLGQTREAWDQEWQKYKRLPSDKLMKAQTLEDKLILPGWEESWKGSKPDRKQDKEKVMSELKIPNVFLPGWNDSWKTSDKHVRRSEPSLPSMKDWRDSLSYCQEHKWCSASMESRYRHYAMMMSKRKLSNELRGSLLDEEVPSEWVESWKSPKAKLQSERSHESKPVPDTDMSDVPLHLQYKKINIPFSTWRESWRVCHARNAGDGEEQSTSKKWKNSWKLSNQNSSAQTQGDGDVMHFSTEHKTHRYRGVNYAEDAMPQNEWSESWKTTKPSPQHGIEQEQAEEKVSKHLSPVVSLCDWAESWRFTATSRPSNSYSLARWAESWRFSNPNLPEQLDQGPRSHSYRQNVPKHHRYLQEVVLPETGPEWTNSWKYLKSDTLDPNMTREESEEWGLSWRVLNPQLYMKKEAWCDQASTEDSKDLRLQLSFLSKEDKKIVGPELSSSEWNMSWRLQVQEH